MNTDSQKFNIEKARFRAAHYYLDRIRSEIQNIKAIIYIMKSQTHFRRHKTEQGRTTCLNYSFQEGESFKFAEIIDFCDEIEVKSTYTLQDVNRYLDFLKIVMERKSKASYFKNLHKYFFEMQQILLCGNNHAVTIATNYIKLQTFKTRN
jgi:hypothetical protein